MAHPDSPEPFDEHPRKIHAWHDSLSAEEIIDVRLLLRTFKVMGFVIVGLIGLAIRDHFLIEKMTEAAIDSKTSITKIEENTSATNRKVDNLERRIAYQKAHPLTIDDTP